MNVGVYIDAYNLYYGGRNLCGRGTAGWRWLDLRALAASLIAQQSSWAGAKLARIVYCTARIDGASNPSGYADQDVYLKALKATGSVDHIEYGYYVSRVKYALLATRNALDQPQIAGAQWPIKVQDARGNHVPDARFMASYLHQEEKGSDVNVASHMLLDVLEGAVDAVVMISNDSDLGFPIRRIRERVPVGTVKPGGGLHAGALFGRPSDGAGNHWWRRLDQTDFWSHQLPAPAAGYTRPSGW